MKAIIFTTLLVLAFADMEECLRLNCPDEYSACKKEVFGCAALALKCQSKCGADHECMKECSLNSGNEKLIAMEACGEINCKNATPFTDECDVNGCIQLFNQQCVSTNAMESIRCSLSFFDQYPECRCAIDY